MISELKNSLWKQFGAGIDMLRNAIMLCPEEYWNTDKRFFYIAYHSLISLDYCLTIPPTNYRSQLPFTITDPDGIPEEALDDIIPDRIYSKKELLEYLQASRLKCRELIEGLTEEKIKQRWIEKPDELSAYVTLQFSTLEILLYNLRHVQHHTAQLNMLLRGKINAAPDWVSEAEEEQ
ncbi:MAG TPA: DinB family protein [Ignavibacteria bacterium]|nr:DinB family protein [Ignavibacteria bacterium]